SSKRYRQGEREPACTGRHSTDAPAARGHRFPRVGLVGADTSANQHPDDAPNAGPQRHDKSPHFVTSIETVFAGESADERAGAGTGKKPDPDANGDVPIASSAHLESRSPRQGL